MQKGKHDYEKMYNYGYHSLAKFEYASRLYVKGKNSNNVVTHFLVSDKSTLESLPSKSNYQNAYDKLIVFKVDEYSLNCVATFNGSLMQIDGNFELTCEITNIEVHNSEVDTQR